MTPTIHVQRENFDIADEIAAVMAGRSDIGAVVTFTGVCRDEDGRLFPVRWQSYVQALAEYQGRLDNAHKSAVAQRIDQALQGPGQIDAEVLDGCRRLATALIAAAEPPRHLPASEFAEVSSEWRRSQD